MDPGLRKLLAPALVGLLVMYPIFNQVAATSLDALYDADHQAQLSSFFDDFFKGWDDIPDDEELKYWDGRGQPPGDGRFDGDDVNDDFQTREGAEGPEGPDRDEDGVPDDEDADPDDPNVQDPDDLEQLVERVVVLWAFNGTDRPASSDGDGFTLDRSYDRINVTYGWTSFSGTASFFLTNRADGESYWSETTYASVPAVSQNQAQRSQQQAIPDRAELQMAYDYSPVGPPGSYQITVTGHYYEAAPSSGGGSS